MEYAFIRFRTIQNINKINNPIFKTTIIICIQLCIIDILNKNIFIRQMVSAFSVPKSKREEKYSSNPGPGQYNPQTTPKITKKKEPQYSLGKQRRLSLDENGVPGPGSYNNHQIKTHLQHPPSYSFGIKAKGIEQKINLGPGSYVPKYIGQESSPSFSFKARSNSVTGQLVPGPGNYEPYKSSVVVDHVAKFGHQKRDLSLSDKFPGPGSYEYRQAFNRYAVKNDPTYKFGARIPQLKPLQVPGPGAYKQKKQIYSKIGGIMSRDIRFSMDKSIELGPGQYDSHPQKIKQKNPSFSVSKSKKDLQYNNFIPGPGSYQNPQNFKKIIEHPPAYQFARDRKLKLEASQVPGPGSYISKQDFNKKNIYIPQKVKLPDGFNVPGPGSYQIKEDLVTSNIKYSLSKDKRDQNYNNNVPGPGSYTSRIDRTNINYGFGSDEKMKFKPSQIPGPGHYELKPHFADVPKYLLNNSNNNSKHE